MGYEKNDLIGHNVNQIMPPLIGEKHNTMILKSFCCNSLPSKKSGIIALPLHKQGYFVMCSLIHRIVPQFNNGIQIIGFLRVKTDVENLFPYMDRSYDPEELVLLLTTDKWVIHTLNGRAIQLLGLDMQRANLKRYIESSDQLPLYKLIPKFENNENFRKLKEEGTCEVVLNVSVFKKLFDIDIENKINNEESIKQSDKFSTQVLESGCSGVLHQIDLHYGKYKSDQPELKMKLIAIIEANLEIMRIENNKKENTIETASIDKKM